MLHRCCLELLIFRPFVVHKACRFSVIGESCRKYHFCHDKSMPVVKKSMFCRDKHAFVATNPCLSGQNIILSRQKRDKTQFCRGKHTFVATKEVRLVAAPASDSFFHLLTVAVCSGRRATRCATTVAEIENR